MISNAPHGSEAAHTFDWTQAETPSCAVLRAVMELTGEDTDALEPLYRAVNPDCLNGIFARATAPNVPLIGGVEFEYNGYRVVVKANGRGYLYDTDVEARPEAIAPTAERESE